MKTLLLICFSFFAASGLAGVEPRNGVFYISYTDFEFKGTPAEITRSYNSNNTHTGLFGYGWRSFIETKITAFPDGTLTLAWWGGGMGDYYEPAVVNRKGLYNMVNAIVEQLIKTGKLNNDPVAIAEKKSYYLTNNKQRAEKYIELQRDKLVPVYIPSPSAQQWTLDVNQTISWNGKNFTAKSWSDSYRFDNTGNMILVNDRLYKMALEYKKGHLSKIVVNDSDVCWVHLNDKGQVAKLIAAGKAAAYSATYEYDSASNLVFSKDAGENVYRFDYDSYHNLVSIRYSDSSSMQIRYDASSNRVIKLVERNNAFVQYQYPYFYTAEGKINYDHYATRIQQFDSLGLLKFTQYKEFENRSREDGSTYQYRILEKSDTLFHEVIYDPEVGNAKYRKKNTREAWSSYDNKRRPSYLHINDSIYKSRYNVNDLPEYFLELDSINKTGNSWVYGYNDDKQLVAVKKNDVQYYFVYNKAGLLTEVRETNGNRLSIELLKDSNIRLKGQPTESLTLDKKDWLLILDAAAGRNSGTVVETVDADKKQTTDFSTKQSTTYPGQGNKLLRRYLEALENLKPRKIEHEWIWERM
ncbi:MAG: hypothetical protein EOO06_16765 [Chitinophagaceae bacterium]|nr:MAG: hypothetical protein EOO06_16765 [Chitinophagaceae bacterium]